MLLKEGVCLGWFCTPVVSGLGIWTYLSPFHLRTSPEDLLTNLLDASHAGFLSQLLLLSPPSAISSCFSNLSSDVRATLPTLTVYPE